nr:CdiA family toxin C-terminal domain-containing protein [Hahella sp. HN01]
MESNGVKGAHNLNEFLILEKSHGINVLNRTEVGNGIYQIEYQIPKYFGNNKDAAKFGKSVRDFSHFKTAKDPKTVCDPAVWTDEAFLEFAQKAASQSFSENVQKFIANNKARVYNTTYEGMDFCVYLDKGYYGNVFVDNIHPRGKK